LGYLETNFLWYEKIMILRMELNYVKKQIVLPLETISCMETDCKQMVWLVNLTWYNLDLEARSLKRKDNGEILFPARIAQIKLGLV
jgi:hypothetical protein